MQSNLKDVGVNAELYRLREFIDRGIYNVAEALAIAERLRRLRLPTAR